MPYKSDKELPELPSHQVSLICGNTKQKFKQFIFENKKGIFIRLHKKTCGCNVIVKDVIHKKNIVANIPKKIK
jgi:hypothetical protein